MALFGKVDQDLALLTRLYQVKPTDCDELYCFQQSELYEFLKREASRRLNEEVSKLPREEQNIYPERVDALPMSEFQMRQYIMLHGVVRRFMDALADGAQIAVADLVQLEALFDEQARREGPGHRRFGSLFAPMLEMPAMRSGIDAVPARGLYLAETAHEMSPVILAQLSRELQALVPAAFQRGAEVTRCDECKSPFPRSRQGQKFCSHRCRTRRSSREAYRDRYLCSKNA